MFSRVFLPLVLVFILFCGSVHLQDTQDDCEDGSQCLTSEFCVNKKCVYTAPDIEGNSCKDGSECLTSEFCVENKCVYTAPDIKGNTCKDGSECLTAEICQNNKCIYP